MTTTAKRASVVFGISTLLTAGAIALSDSSPAIAQEEPELRIAAIIAVTGPASALGAPGRNAVDVFGKMERTKEWPGVNGVFNITPTDYLGLDKRSTFLSQIKGGKFVLIEE